MDIHVETPRQRGPAEIGNPRSGRRTVSRFARKRVRRATPPLDIDDLFLLVSGLAFLGGALWLQLDPAPPAKPPLRHIELQPARDHAGR